MQPLIETVAALGLDGRVHLIGWIDPHDVVSYMAAGDVVVGPSKPGADGTVEAFGLTMVEAMASGTPVVATRVGGIPEVVIEGQTGALVEPGSPRCIAEAVMSITMDDVESAKIMALAGQRRVRALFSREVAAKSFSSLYTSVIASSNGGN